MKIKVLFVWMVVLLLGAGCSPVSEPPSVGDEVGAGETVWANYASWVPLFETPQNVSTFLMLLCRTLTEHETQYINSPHAQHFVQVFANPVGVETLRQPGARTFPEGSVIVKEKWSQDGSLQLDKAVKEPAGLGIMIKREPGFDAAGGDWEYVYADRAGTVTQDQKQLENCRACHMAERARDSVFYPSVLAE